MTEETKINLKILVVGKSGAGKTSFVNKWLKNKFNENCQATIVLEYVTKLYNYEGRIYKINLWDIAGQDQFANVTKIFSKDAVGCITMADALDENSLNETLKWKKSLDDAEQFPDGKTIPNMLIQNKIDLVPEDKVKDMTKLEEFCQENKFDCCFKVSAKTGYNVHESMDKLIDIIVKRIDDINLKEINLNRDTLTIEPEIHCEKDKYRSKQTNCC